MTSTCLGGLAWRAGSPAKAEPELAPFLATGGQGQRQPALPVPGQGGRRVRSLLDPTVEHVGGVDVAVAIPLKPTDGNVAELSLAHARASGRRFATFTDEMFWPEIESASISRPAPVSCP